MVNRRRIINTILIQVGKHVDKVTLAIFSVIKNNIKGGSGYSRYGDPVDLFQIIFVNKPCGKVMTNVRCHSGKMNSYSAAIPSQDYGRR